MTPARTHLARVALLAVLLAGCSKPKPTALAPAAPPPSALAHTPTLVVPEKGAYEGAYISFGESEDDVSLEAIEDFERKAGKHQAIIAFSSFWGEQSFPQAPVQIVERHGSIPLVFWSPWDRPYSEEQIVAHGPDKFRLESILTGVWDQYIDQWADGAKATGQPMFVSLCNEMNGDWFPWGGKYYGAGQPIAGSAPVRYIGPEFFKRAYRHIVDRVRARGAGNILWVFHANNFSEPYEAWNTISQFYPGSAYVDWLGLSVYGQLFPDGKWDLFDQMIRVPYDEMCRLDPHKPVMVAEWGVGEFPASGDKAAWIRDGFQKMEHYYPRLHAAVYWHERWQNPAAHGGERAPSGSDLFYSNLKIDSSPGAEAAYRQGLTSPFWLDYPVYR